MNTEDQHAIELLHLKITITWIHTLYSVC